MLLSNNPALWIFLRHMRRPIIIILVAYAISVLGLTLIPGITIDGETSYLSIFHSLYVISYTATTIGFGEVPHAFSNGQRFWLVIVIHFTVVSWAYTISSILGLLQNPTFKQILKRRGFAKRVKSINIPFYIICGFGETGSFLTKSLIERGYGVVIIEINPERESELILQNYSVYVPHINGDASNIELLKDAGIETRYCAGVIALTDDDTINQRIMVVSQFIRHRLYTACRCDNSRMRAILKNADVDLLINVFDIFAERIRLAIIRPHLHTLIDLIRRGTSQKLENFSGKWVIFGWGRFGSTIGKMMRKCGLEVIPVDVEAKAVWGEKNAIVSENFGDDGMKELLDGARGVVIATPNDPANMALLLAARSTNKDIFSIVRQNRTNNSALFEQLNADFTMLPRNIIIDEIISNLTLPLLGKFFELVENEPEEWAQMMLRLISKTIVKPNTPLHVWTIEINQRKTSAIMQLVNEGVKIELRHLIHQHDKENVYADSQIYTFPILIARQQEYFLAPSLDFELLPRDRILFVGHQEEEKWMLHTFQSLPLCEHIVFGKPRPRSFVINWLRQKKFCHNHKQSQYQ